MEITTSERALLGLFMAKIHRIDPDVLVVGIFMFFIKYSFVIYGELLSKLMNCTGVIVVRSKFYAPIFIAHFVSTEEIFALFLFHLCDNCKYIF